MGTMRRAGVALAGVVAGCAGPAGPDPEPMASSAAPLLAAAGVEESVTGGGQFFHPTLGQVTLAFTATRHGDGSVSGRWQQHQFDLDFTYQGDVTCFAVDQVNHRAWIGGVVTLTNDPDPIAAPGKDAWFRVLDRGQDEAEPDRSTFLGFEGSAGVETSEEYCQLQLWPEDNARTWPLEHGNLVIH